MQLCSYQEVQTSDRATESASKCPTAGVLLVDKNMQEHQRPCFDLVHPVSQQSEHNGSSGCIQTPKRRGTLKNREKLKFCFSKPPGVLWFA
jgi:hypothetical protein